MSNLPKQTSFIVPLSYGIWWDARNLASSVIPTDEYGKVSYDASVGTKHRAVFMPETASLPSWVSSPGATMVGGGLHLYVTRHMVEDKLFNTPKLHAGAVSAAWSSSSTVAYMNGTVWPTLTVGSGKDLDREGWYTIPMPGTVSNMLTYGVGLMCFDAYSSPGNALAVFDFYDLKAFIEVYYQMAWPTAPDPSVTRRTIIPVLSAKMADPNIKLDSVVEMKILKNDIRPDLENVDISQEAEMGNPGDWFSSEVSFPDTWKIPSDSPGGLSVQTEDKDLMDGVIGCMVEMSMGLRDEYGNRDTVIVRKARISDVSQKRKGRYDLALTSPLFRDTKREPLISIFEGSYVDYDGLGMDSHTIRIMYDILINMSEAKYEETYPTDWYWLLQRYAGVWTLRTLTSSDIEGLGVDGLIDEVAQLYGLFVGLGNDNKVLCWHPAVYRESMRIWSLDIDIHSEIESVELTRKPPLATKMTSMREDSGTWYPIELPAPVVMDNKALQPAAKDIRFVAGSIENALESLPWVLLTMLRQAAYRHCGRIDVIQITLDKEFLPAQNGDQVLVTWKEKGYVDTPFMVMFMGGGPSDPNRVSFELWRFLDWPAAHSLFQNDRMKGIYRWIDKDGYADNANSTWVTDGATGTATDSGGGCGDWWSSGNAWWWSYQGVLIGRGENNNYIQKDIAFTPGSSSVIDAIECHIAIKSTRYFYPDDSKQDWWVWKWQDPRGNGALCLYIHRLGWPAAGTDPNPFDSELRVGYTTDITAATITWSWYITAGQGIGPPRASASVIAVWVEMHHNHVDFYINGLKIGKQSIASKYDIEDLSYRASGYDAIRIGALKLLQADATTGFSKYERCHEDGTDQLIT